MKTIFKLFFLTLLGFFLASCDKDEDRAIVGDGTKPMLQTSVQNIVLSKDIADKEAIKFDFIWPDYGVNLVSSNELQLGIKGTNFETLKSVVIPGTSTSLTYTVQDFNALLLNLGVPVNQTETIEVRLKSSLTQDAGIRYSDVVEITVTPYALISYMYLPGAYQGWNPSTANQLISAASNGIYEGLITFKPVNNNTSDLEFKITPNKNWNESYGSEDGKTLKVNGPNLQGLGYDTYKVIVDLNTKQYNMKLNSLGIIGSATPNGWNGPDINMAWNDRDKVFEVTTSLTAGMFKFRLNDDWGVNYGMDAEEGRLKIGGADIPVPITGTYKIVLDIINQKYTLIKQ